jgi:hypothetical protein
LNRYQRPWWVWALRLPALKTTLHEDHRPGHKRFIIEGEPQFKSMAWVTYGPALAVVAVVIMGGLAWALEIRQQSIMIKTLFVCLTIILPMLVWIMASALINSLVERALQQEAAAMKERVQLDLDLTARTLRVDETTSIPFDEIADFKLMSNGGIYYQPHDEMVPLVYLMMETKQGQKTLLKQGLGTVQQKLELISQLKALTGSPPD